MRVGLYYDANVYDDDMMSELLDEVKLAAIAYLAKE
jgi:hypothetical protein